MRARRLFEIAAQPLSMEVEKIKTLRESKMNLAFVKFDKETFVKNSKVTEAEIKATLANAEFAKRVEDYFHANAAEFSQGEQVHAQHILIKIGPGTSDETAKQKIAEIQKKAQTEDFGKLAVQYTEDAGTKANKGDLGFFAQGKMVPEFDKAAFSQAPGVVGAPVKTAYGYHLIKVLEKKAAHTENFDEAKKSIAGKLLAADQFETFTKGLEEALAKGDSAQVDAQLKRSGLAWEETGFFDLSADMIPKVQSQEVNKALFAMSDAKPLYPHLIREAGDKYILKLKAAKKETAPESYNVGSQLAKERSSGLFGAWIEQAKRTAHIERNPQILGRAQ